MRTDRVTGWTTPQAAWFDQLMWSLPKAYVAAERRRRRLPDFLLLGMSWWETMNELRANERRVSMRRMACGAVVFVDLLQELQRAHRGRELLGMPVAGSA